MLNLENEIRKIEALIVPFYEDKDWKNPNKIGDKIGKIINKIVADGQDKEMYTMMFSHSSPLLRYYAAIESYHRNYDLYKSLAIVKDIANNAFQYSFVEDKSLNQILQERFSKETMDRIAYKVSFYEEVGDDRLFRQYYQFLQYASDYIDGYLGFKPKVQQEGLEKAVSLAREVESEGKIVRFMTIVYDKNKGTTSKANLITYAVVCAQIGYNIAQSVQILSNLISGGESVLNPRMLQFCRERIAEINR